MIAHLVDTNILLRLVQAEDPQHALVLDVVDRLQSEAHPLLVTPQNVMEFWNVATRPTTRNGFGRTPAQTEALVQMLEGYFDLLPDIPAIYPTWRRLVSRYAVSGIQVHDARLVAAMQVGGVRHILTFNDSDFARYAPEGIVTVNPLEF